MCLNIRMSGSKLDGLLLKPLPNHNSFTAEFQYK